MCAEKWQEIFPWTLVGSVLWDQHFNDVLSNYVRGKDTRPLCVLCGAGLWASHSLGLGFFLLLLKRHPSPFPWKNFSGLLALWQWRRRELGVNHSLAFNVSPCSFLQRSCSWHSGTVPFVTSNTLLARRLQTNFSFQSQHCLAENFQQQNHGISLAASVLLSREQEHKEGQQLAPCKRMEHDPEICTFLLTPQN